MCSREGIRKTPFSKPPNEASGMASAIRVFAAPGNSAGEMMKKERQTIPAIASPTRRTDAQSLAGSLRRCCWNQSLEFWQVAEWREVAVPLHVTKISPAFVDRLFQSGE